ncbi:DivIVA domain-containing protein [Hymenobacter sp. H14-R3]|uniref:DivIVA domain-containing protein n=1 Tax=Hymenobacter sp. H14-R3 TaxID=3046308 RepID=UPI0024B8CBCD|nr:DivIVA domain-containing protein [Hymenobacter sp. H14-R3]MDJ0367844.1 DivIVA domain-containing protein [Hymenobacter sp. H14-R3]
MKITALDIRQKTFEKSFRGVDKDEVQAFLSTVSQQWERLGDENRELRLKLEHALHDVQKMREVESSLYRTLKTAEDTGNSITEQAQRDADLRRREAQLLAEQTLSEARQRARAIVDEAYQTAEKTVADMQKEVSGLGHECQSLEQQLDTLVRGLHHLASDALEKVERARARPKNGPTAILSRAASVQVKRPADAPAPEPSPTPDMNVTTDSSRATAAAIAPTPAASFGANGPAARATQPTPGGTAPTGYNPKPGQQPDPRNPDQAPRPDIERPQAPRENPGIAPAPHIDQPGPEQVPNPPAPYVEPMRPEIQPIGPSHPEIQQPQPMTHPGMAAKPQAEPVGEKSFFDEI